MDFELVNSWIAMERLQPCGISNYYLSQYPYNQGLLYLSYSFSILHQHLPVGTSDHTSGERSLPAPSLAETKRLKIQPPSLCRLDGPLSRREIPATPMMMQELLWM